MGNNRTAGDSRPRADRATPESIDVVQLDAMIETDLDSDDVFNALSNRRRRYILSTLAEGREKETLDTLAKEIVAWEEDKRVDDVTEEEARNVQASLYHNHVPRLAEVGLVDYKQVEDSIVCSVDGDELSAALEDVGTSEGQTG